MMKKSLRAAAMRRWCPRERAGEKGCVKARLCVEAWSFPDGFFFACKANDYERGHFLFLFIRLAGDRSYELY